MSELEYFISEKDSILVVSLVGAINPKSSEAVQACSREVLSKEAKHVVLSFRDVLFLESDSIWQLTELQQAIREKPAQLRLCFLKPELGVILVEQGAIRLEEVRYDILDALFSFNMSSPESR